VAQEVNGNVVVVYIRANCVIVAYEVVKENQFAGGIPGGNEVR
jgi:hypothetical protein